MKTLLHLLYELKIKDGLPHVYLDMDGVLVNLEKGALKVNGVPIGDIPRPVRWKKVTATTDFWKNLEWMPSAKKLWNFLKPYEPSIMSAYTPNEPNSAGGKEDWLKKNVEKLSRGRINLVMRADKQKFARDGRTQAPNILIDDHIKNVREWESKGGIAIHHTSVERTLTKLGKLGFA